jgi:hypothetical protein
MAARDSLSMATTKAACVFVGRLPRRSPLDALAQLFLAAGVPPRQLIPSRDTYLFVELPSVAAVAVACQLLNGAALGGSALVVQPAVSLTKLFIGGIHRRVDAATIHDAIAAVEPVRPRGAPTPPDGDCARRARAGAGPARGPPSRHTPLALPPCPPTTPPLCAPPVAGPRVRRAV